jgi:hypothetical protein
VGKEIRKTNDEVKVFGLSGAAQFLQCCQGTVLNYANQGRLAHVRDSSGKRLFKLADLRKLKQANQIRFYRRVH